MRAACDRKKLTPALPTAKAGTRLSVTGFVSNVETVVRSERRGRCCGRLIWSVSDLTSAAAAARTASRASEHPSPTKKEKDSRRPLPPPPHIATNPHESGDACDACIPSLARACLPACPRAAATASGRGSSLYIALFLDLEQLGTRFAGWRNSAGGRFLRVCRPNSHL